MLHVCESLNQAAHLIVWKHDPSKYVLYHQRSEQCKLCNITAKCVSTINDNDFCNINMI